MICGPGLQSSLRSGWFIIRAVRLQLDVQVFCALSNWRELGRDGRLIFSLNYSDADFAQLPTGFVAAAGR